MLQRTSSPRTCLANAVPISSSSSCELALPHALIYGTTITITTKLINSSPVIATPKFHNPPPLLIIHTAFPSLPFQPSRAQCLVPGGGCTFISTSPTVAMEVSVSGFLQGRRIGPGSFLLRQELARLSECLLFFFHGTSHKVASWPS